MTDNNATQPAEKVGPIRQWIKDHPNIWEFILFNVLSNISTITRFVVTWIGTAIFISGMGLTQPFHFLIFNYDTASQLGRPLPDRVRRQRRRLLRRLLRKDRPRQRSGRLPHLPACRGARPGGELLRADEVGVQV